MTADIVTDNQSVQKLSRINQLAKKAADQLGLILLGVRVGQQGRNKNLEITIYRKEPTISFSDCEQMSRSLEHLIETEETGTEASIADLYALEVVSPGIDRQLTTALEFNIFAGSQVRILAKEKIASCGTDFIATLSAGNEHSVTISQAFTQAAKDKGKVSKTKSKAPVKTATDIAPVGTNDQLTIDLQQIHKIYLWPGS